MADTGGVSKPMRVILIGMMGSGKSTVGRALAARTGWPFVDNDELVERDTGSTARDILDREGEAALRRAEAAALRAAVAMPPPAIVASAAGTILDPDAREVLRQSGLVAWLRAPAPILAERAAGAAHRPWLDGDAEAWFVATLAEREPLYADVADLEVDVATADLQAAADRILDALARA